MNKYLEDELKNIFSGGGVVVEDEKLTISAEIFEDDVIITSVVKDNSLLEILELSNENISADFSNTPATFYKLLIAGMDLWNKVNEEGIKIKRLFSDDFSSYQSEVIVSNKTIELNYSQFEKNKKLSVISRIVLPKTDNVFLFFKTLSMEIEQMN